MRKYFLQNQNEKQWYANKDVLRGKFIVLNYIRKKD